MADDLFSVYDDIIKSAARRTNPQLKGSLYSSVDTNPDEEAGLHKLSQKVKIPVEALRADRGAEARRLAAVQGRDDLPTASTNFLSSPDNAKLAHDDVDNLSLTERLLTSAGNFLRNDVPAIATTYGARIGAGLQKGLGGLQRFMGEAVPNENGFSIYADDPELIRKGTERYQEGKMISETIDAEKPLKSYAGKIVSSALESIGFMAPGLALGAVSGPAAPVTALGTMGLLTGGQAYGEARDKGITRQDATDSAAIQGATEVATELLPFMALAKFFKPGKLTTKLAHYYLAEVPGEHIATAVQNTTGKVFEEADPEKRKQAAIDYFFSSEHAQDQIDTFFTTIVQGAILGGTAAGVHKVGSRSDKQIQADETAGSLATAAARTNATSKLMTSLGEMASSSKLRERLPEKFQEFMQQAKAEGGVDNVYIPADRFSTFFQEQGKSPVEMAQELTGDRAAYMEAIATGGDVVIPLEVYTTIIAPSEYHQELAKDVRLHPGDMTQRELEEWSGKMPEEFDAIFKDLETEGKNVPGDQKVYDAVLGELMGVGRVRGTAEREAMLWQSRYRTRAERLGKDAWALYEENPLRVRRPMPEFMTRRDFVDTSIDPFLDRIRANDVPTESQAFGESLGDFLRMRGVQDSGGELASIGVDEGIKPFQRKMVQENGLALDEARDSAIKAGYLPEGATTRDFIDAVDKEARGKSVYSAANQNEKAVGLKMDLEQLQQFLSSLDLDVSMMTNEEIRKAIQGQSFDQSDDQTYLEVKRGSITFVPGFRNIALLEKADLSTFLHESGHAWLEEMKQDATIKEAPEQLRQDWETLASWGGFAPDTSTIPVEAHEKFARAVEAYLMEGKAPSVELQPAFQRFKAWLFRIYRSIKGLDVELTDEVRRVLDRMLATDEEIKRAEDLQSFHPLFADAEAAGMTEREFKAYRAEIERAHTEAETQLQQKLMKEITREQEAWWKEERAKLLTEVQAEAQQEPVYQAFKALTDGTDFEGNAAPEGFKLSKDDLVRMYGKEFVKKLPRSFRYLYAKEGGLHPDAVAEVFGFSSGDEMIRKMANTPPMKKFVEAETDVRMRQKYGDMLNDGTVADEALKAVHSDYQGQVLRAELRALRRKQREVAPFVKAEKDQAAEALKREKTEREYERRWLDAEKKLALEIERGAAAEELRKIREEIRTNREGARRARLEMEAGIPPLEAFKMWAAQAIGAKALKDITPGVYARAEQKAGKAAFEAASKGKFEKAGEEKQKQLLNHYLYMEAVKAKEDADKIYDYAKRLEKPATQQRIGKAGGDYLEQINAILERYEFKRVTLETLTKRRSLLEWAQEQEEMGLEPSIPDELLNESSKRNYKELTIDELRAIRDALKNIEHLSKEVNRIRIDNEEFELEEALNELTASVTQNFDVKKLPIDKETLSWIEKQGEKLSRLDASLIKTEQLIEWMDGGKIDGPWSRMIFQPIAKAESNEHNMTLKYTAKLADLVEAYGKEKKAGLMEKVFISSLNESLTRQAVIAVALNTGNESNQKKLMTGYGWTDYQLDEILSHLDAHDWDFVQRIWDTIEELWPEIAAMEKRMTGVAPDKVLPREVTNEFGSWRGGYYPVVYDSLHSAAGEKQTDAKGDRLFENTYVRATTEKGHTKARIEEAAFPILLSLEVLPQHMAQVIHDLTHREAVVAANRLLANRDMRSTLNATIGAPYYKMLKQWLANVANDRNIDRTGNEFWTRFMGTLRTNATIVGMGFRMTTMFSQLAGLSQSLDMVKGKYLGTALLRFTRHPFESAAWVAEKSGEMKHRRNSLDRDIRDGVRKLMGKHGAKQWIQAKAFAGVALFDAMVSVPTWMGAYEQAKAEGLSEGDSIAAADRAVRLSQGSGGAKDLAAVQRSNEMMKLFTMFYSYFSVLYNRLRNMGRLKSIGEIGFMDVAWKSFVMVMVPAIMGDLLAGRGPDDDEDKALWALRKILVYPSLTVPIVRDIGNSFESGRPYSLTPMSRLLEMTAKLPAQVEAVAENRKDLDDLIFQNFDLLGYAFGLPTGQPRTTTKYIWDLTEGDVRAEDLGDVLKGLAFGHKKEGHKR
ncbi:hypothetical protein [Geobacter sp. SVR]|uniref:hypothetical protein n=1 Tax=Geobacter sp. SVR TaxID=2495594 RepID=UPI00143EF8B6|nr:hypothetical protein [Geobacter sp. SVR]BCS54787.1 hypothetical protein GSVR_30950 [Geobacter sp. SVR]GCF86405.1 hypothetical protein GSbR_30050 [Geobacter sp. SVR]